MKRTYFWIMKISVALLAQFHQCSTYIFYARGAQKRKKRQSSRQYLFTLLGSMCVKAVQRMLMKLSPWYTRQKNYRWRGVEWMAGWVTSLVAQIGFWMPPEGGDDRRRRRRRRRCPLAGEWPRRTTRRWTSVLPYRTGSTRRQGSSLSHRIFWKSKYEFDIVYIVSLLFF